MYYGRMEPSITKTAVHWTPDEKGERCSPKQGCAAQKRKNTIISSMLEHNREGHKRPARMEEPSIQCCCLFAPASAMGMS